MEILFLCIIVFLFILAVFDLSVGVSNDAVNFLNSAIGSRAAAFRTIIIVASVGVFCGAAMSNGMMDIARHGIFRPEHFSFYELICIFMAVMVTDIILLDIFNSLGMPTSTTVSMVFELLGAAFAVALIKMAADGSDLGLTDLLNTGKALSVILGIFLSVAIAFVTGTLVQFVTRAIFSFEYRSKLRWKIGIFGGFATTMIIYFLMIKGAKDLTFMTPEVKTFIARHTLLILAVCFVVLSALMQLLHALKVNVLKVVVLIGTFALAMAFAGNDLVNFIGVPLSGFSAWRDYVANGGGDAHGFMMGSLNAPANTPLYFLIAAGVIMVASLATSKKAQRVSKTEIGLAGSSEGDEMFGSSRIARRLVRMSLSAHGAMQRHIPQRVRSWLDRRFDTSQIEMEQGAAFDLVRGAVNLMLAGMLIAMGTSLKLPLSTTFVTFMVAMGTSLADRAWSRESAVFRITGVISVIGGWFITAGVAFIGAALVVAAMYWGGGVAMILVALVAIAIIIRSNMRFKEKKADTEADTMFRTIISTHDKAEAHSLLNIYMAQKQAAFVTFARETYDSVTRAFVDDDARTLSRADHALDKEKTLLKNACRKETLCWRQVEPSTAIEKSAWFHLANNSCMAMCYNLRRIAEVCGEHVSNNFRRLPEAFRDSFAPLRHDILDTLAEADTLLIAGNTPPDDIQALRRRCDGIKDAISHECSNVHEHLRNDAPEHLTVAYVYLNLLQESQEMISSLRKLLRARAKLQA